MVKRIMQVLGALVVASGLFVFIVSPAGGRELPSQEATAAANISEVSVEGSSETIPVLPTATIVLEPTVTATVTVTSTPEPTETPTQVPIATATEEPTYEYSVCLSTLSPVAQNLIKLFGTSEILLSTKPSQGEIPFCMGNDPENTDDPQVSFYLEDLNPECFEGKEGCVPVAIERIHLGATINKVSFRTFLGNSFNRGQMNALFPGSWLEEDASDFNQARYTFVLYEIPKTTGPCPERAPLFFVNADFLKSLENFSSVSLGSICNR